MYHLSELNMVKITTTKLGSFFYQILSDVAKENIL